MISNDWYRLVPEDEHSSNHRYCDPANCPALLRRRSDTMANPAPATITTPSTTYEPWTDGYAVGFKVTRKSDGKVQYIYLNPSMDDPPDSTPDVFVYINGDPTNHDCPQHYYDMSMEDA